MHVLPFCRSIVSCPSVVRQEHEGEPMVLSAEFGVGDVWTWTAIDADTKLVPSWFVGRRNAEDGFLFMMDLKGRLANSRVEMTTDGLRAYSAAIGFSFGRRSIGPCCRSTTARTPLVNAATARHLHWLRHQHQAR
jgi:IS1 family transposase